LEALESRLAPAVTIKFDYTYDTLHFFTKNPAAKTVLQEAAQILGRQLHNELAAIQPDSTDSWTMVFTRPNTGTTVERKNLTIPENTILIYVGGANLPGDEIGYGGPGGGFVDTSNSPTFVAAVESRGQDPYTTFGPWGGTVAFNLSTDWSFAGTAGPPGNHDDFLSVALHEIGHVLGIGTAPTWWQYVRASYKTFVGPHAEATYGGPVPLDVTLSHWAESDRSFGLQPTMTPVLNFGTRNTFTSLDWAGLADIGWQVDHFVVTAQPPSKVQANQTFTVGVEVVDPLGHVDKAFKGDVTLAMGNDPGGGALAGTLTVPASKGVATFHGLSINLPGNGYTLHATAMGVPARSTNAFTVKLYTATQLVVTTESPGTVSAGQPFGLVIQAEDDNGNVDTTFTGKVTLKLASNPGHGTLGGHVVVSFKDGVATFTDLTLNKAANGYRLEATCPGLRLTTTAPFDVTAP
jgi:hypothetical protein